MAKKSQASPRYMTWIVVLSIAILAGLVTAYQVFTKGLVMWNATDVVFWTLPKVTYVFLSLMSTGLALVASIPLVFGIEKYGIVAKRAVFLAIAVLFAGLISLALDTGSLLNAIYFFISPNFSSLLWWMGMLYAIELVLLLTKFWRMHVGDWHSRISKVSGILALFNAIAAGSVLGAVFGMTEARPTFSGDFMPVYFLLAALLSGLALFILVSLVFEFIKSNGISKDDTSQHEDLSKMLGFVTGIALFFFVWRAIVSLSTTLPGFTAFEYRVGAWPFHFELWLGLIVPFLLMIIPSLRAISLSKVVASTLVLLGLFVGRMEFFLIGQIKPLGSRAMGLPEFVSYAPSMWEWLVVASALAIVLLMFTFGERYLKLDATG